MINLLAKINIFNENDYKEVIETSLKMNRKIIFFYLNSQIVYETQKNAELKNHILNSDFLIADGYSIVWAYKRLLKKSIIKVVFTYSYFKFMRDVFIANDVPIFFLGATQKNIERSVKIENEFFPGLNIVGYHNGFFKVNEESDLIIETINNSKAKVLIVGMGCPLAETWIMGNKDKINSNLIFSVGGFFDFLAKDKIIAPNWMYNSGFEWVFRLIQEPKRLWKRYLISNIYWLYRLIKSS